MTKETYFDICHPHIKDQRMNSVWRENSALPKKSVIKSSQTSININHVLPKKTNKNLLESLSKMKLS